VINVWIFILFALEGQWMGKGVIAVDGLGDLARSQRMKIGPNNAMSLTMEESCQSQALRHSYARDEDGLPAFPLSLTSAEEQGLGETPCLCQKQDRSVKREENEAQDKQSCVLEGVPNCQGDHRVSQESRDLWRKNTTKARQANKNEIKVISRSYQGKRKPRKTKRPSIELGQG
jgi:hypothetical protein